MGLKSWQLKPLPRFHKYGASSQIPCSQLDTQLATLPPPVQKISHTTESQSISRTHLHVSSRYWRSSAPLNALVASTTLSNSPPSSVVCSLEKAIYDLASQLHQLAIKYCGHKILWPWGSFCFSTTQTMISLRQQLASQLPCQSSITKLALCTYQEQKRTPNSNKIVQCIWCW